MIRTCVICGKKFETTSSRQLTCSKQCSHKEHYIKEAERKKIQYPYRVCKICGKQFIPIGKEQFCSDKCKEKSRKNSMMNSKAKIIERKHASGEIRKRLTPEERALKNQKQKKYYTCAVCGKKFERHYNEIYCSEECRKKALINYHKTYKRTKSEVSKSTAICKICGKEFTPKNSRQIYCSDECRLKVAQKLRANIYQRKHIVQYVICPICGKKFPQTKYFMKYCSDECRNIAKQQKTKPEYIEKNCVICGKLFLTKSRSTLCCSDKCHKKYRVQVQTKYAHKKQKERKLEKAKIKEQKELQLKLEKKQTEEELRLKNEQATEQLKLKKQQNDMKHFNIIKGKVKFPKYMKEEILHYLDSNQFDLVFQFIEIKLAKKVGYVGKIGKDKIHSILFEKTDDKIEKLEEYLAKIVFNDKYKT